jgi:hypothetical protein
MTFLFLRSKDAIGARRRHHWRNGAFSFLDNAYSALAGTNKIKGRKMTDTGSRADTRDMCMVHATFRRESGTLPGLARNLQAADIQRSQTIGDHIDILSIYLCADHHR